MATTIKCPKCGNEFEPNESIRDQIKKELNQKAIEWQKRKDEEFQLKMEEERRRMQQHLEENIRRSVSLDYENQLRLLAQTNKDNEEKLKEAREQQLELFKKEQELKNREAELELSVQKKLQLERERLSVEIRKLEEQRIATIETEYRLRMKEMEEKLESQRKLAEEMRRKAEQGSMQLQGEVQELALQEMLQSTFPFDLILEVAKGVRGADCIQVVRSNFGQECGKIIYESKRTTAFANEWIEKLKTDMRSQGADIAVIVTKAMPRDMDCFGIRDGVWVCDFSEVKALAGVLREGVIRVFNTAKTNENRGDKMHLLYGYLTSSEFAEQWKAIREGFLAMKISIQRERDAMERLWKTREKQLEKVLLNATHIRGSIEGIAGMDAIDLNLLGNGEEDDSLFPE
ncbi:MAG TPA: DUF2130 domain-containing protein [Chitinophagaceae bacterium]|jgi:hypothetical protein|nr:DUF2130 domain-containing protein [Chitinophagaceae bacterium]